MVLAEYAAQIAAGEKDGAGPVFAADAGLFPVVGSGARNHGEGGGTADAARQVDISFCPTLTGTIVTDYGHIVHSLESFGLFGNLTRNLSFPAGIILFFCSYCKNHIKMQKST
jgi:hypothetical protein